MIKSLQIQKTYKNIPEFNLCKPNNINEVSKFLKKFGEDCHLMAGGVDLLQDLKSGLKINNLIYLKSVPELNAIEMVDDSIRVGACVTHRSFEINPIINKFLPSLAKEWSNVGNIRIRIVGTIGGNILTNDPNYDVTPALAALNSVAHYSHINGSDRIPIIELNRKRPPGFLTAIEIPIRNNLAFSMNRTLKPYVNLAISAIVDSDSIREIRVGIGCAFSTPLLIGLKDVLNISALNLKEQVTKIAHQFIDKLPNPIDDVFASASYRRRMIGVLLADQILFLAGRK